MENFAKVAEKILEYKQLKNDIETKQSPVMVTGLTPVQQSHILYSLGEQIPYKILVITHNESTALSMCNDVNQMCGEGFAEFFPSRDYNLQNTLSSSHETEHQRLNVLANLAMEKCKVVFSSIEAACSITIPKDILVSSTITMKIDKEYKISEIVDFLVKTGYTACDQVEGKCQFAKRGGIIDIFPPNLKNPVRIEFWGDEIDSLSYFEVDTQRRTEPLKSFTITPAREVLINEPQQLVLKLEQIKQTLKGKYAKEQRETIDTDIENIKENVSINNQDKFIKLLYGNNSIFDYFKGEVFALSSPTEAKEAIKNVLWQNSEDIKILLEDKVLYSGLDNFYLDFTDVASVLSKSSTILFDTFGRTAEGIPLKHIYDIKSLRLSSWSGEYSILKEDLDDYKQGGYCVLIYGGTEKNSKNLVSDLQRDGFSADYVDDFSDIVAKKIYVTQGSLSGGFDYPQIRFAVISINKSGSGLKLKKPKKAGKNAIKNLSDLSVGDYVVHVSHGIGVFSGIVKREIHGITKDYIKIRYAGTDELFVPVTQLDLVTKYIGTKEDGTVKLNKLNSAEWQKTRQRVKKAVADMADELIKLYAERLNAKGFAFSKDTDWQNDFEGRFPYEETDDQLRCIREIKDDMESGIPMDRLLCGDVGFGKTEVAIRAAFKCVMDSKQCAVLVPTTILAWQHFKTFSQRMEGFPVKIELLSRFRTAKQQEEIIKELKRGEIDIIIGTHRVVQKDVKFKDLGLCIIDEEQRFGVTHKEKFKQMRNDVDMLTLSATPIPRTLNMAMSGIRDMSTIEQAPQDRQSVQTYVIEQDMGIVMQAIERELKRGGQVFYIHNRVDTILECAAKIAKIVPDAKIETAHGKMTEEALSKVWQKLMDKEIDILVCTTIIETGVDVTNCNTLIIEDADKMGLSQLYQLRGRVGRSTRRAFAYLMVQQGKSLTDIASKRLSAIKEFTTFGSGFRIAMRDLEIRGAGNILGAQQHGHMESVGYEMYLRLLSDAISQKKGEKVETKAMECTVDIEIEAHIPESYIENLSQRIDIYKKISAITCDEDAEDLYDELVDRFGDPPKSVIGLVEVAKYRNSAAALGINEITQRGDCILMYQEVFNMENASLVAAKLKGRVTVNAGKKPYISVKIAKGENAVDTVKLALKNMIYQ